MSDHQERADELEREAEDMAQRTGKLEGEISETRDEWERKQRDPKVPGATGEPTPAPADDEPDEDDEREGRADDADADEASDDADEAERDA